MNNSLKSSVNQWSIYAYKYLNTIKNNNNNTIPSFAVMFVLAYITG